MCVNLTLCVPLSVYGRLGDFVCVFFFEEFAISYQKDSRRVWVYQLISRLLFLLLDVPRGTTVEHYFIGKAIAVCSSSFIGFSFSPSLTVVLLVSLRVLMDSPFFFLLVLSTHRFFMTLVCMCMCLYEVGRWKSSKDAMKLVVHNVWHFYPLEPPSITSCHRAEPPLSITSREAVRLLGARHSRSLDGLSYFLTLV